MSYMASEALQSAVYQHLSADPALNAVVGGRSMTRCPPERCRRCM